MLSRAEFNEAAKLLFFFVVVRDFTQLAVPKNLSFSEVLTLQWDHIPGFLNVISIKTFDREEMVGCYPGPSSMRAPTTLQRQLPAAAGAPKRPYY